MIRSLFSKILLSHLIILLITTASIGILLSHLVTNFLIEDKRDELIREGTATVKLLDPITQNPNLYPDLLINLSNLSGNTLWIADKDYNLISGQAPGRWQNRMRRHHMMNDTFFTGEICSRIYRKRTDEDPSIVVAVPFASNPNIALFIHTPITGISETSIAIQKLLFLSIIFSIFLAGFSAFFLSRSLIKPIRNISQSAEKFASGIYTTRTTACGKDEIGKLGQTFNNMATALEQIEKNRREFFSDITHELKTPIASIQAVTESILDDMVPDKQTRNRYLKTILAQTNHMNKLISDLLDLARLESGQLQFNYEAVSLKKFSQEIQQKYHSLLKDKNQTLTFNLPTGCETITTDATRLDQILSNLISNAIRHSFKDSIIQIDIYTKNKCIYFAVINTGEGIPADELPYVWERFYRVDKSRSRNNGGTGLGLSITKKLVEEMGGTITVQSILHQKTSFIIALPFDNQHNAK